MVRTPLVIIHVRVEKNTTAFEPCHAAADGCAPVSPSADTQGTINGPGTKLSAVVLTYTR